MSQILNIRELVNHHLLCVEALSPFFLQRHVNDYIGFYEKLLNWLRVVMCEASIRLSKEKINFWELFDYCNNDRVNMPSSYLSLSDPYIRGINNFRKGTLYYQYLNNMCLNYEVARNYHGHDTDKQKLKFAINHKTEIARQVPVTIASNHSLLKSKHNFEYLKRGILNAEYNNYKEDLFRALINTLTFNVGSVTDITIMNWSLGAAVSRMRELSLHVMDDALFVPPFEYIRFDKMLQHAVVKLAFCGKIRLPGDIVRYILTFVEYKFELSADLKKLYGAYNLYRLKFFHEIVNIENNQDGLGVSLCNFINNRLTLLYRVKNNFNIGGNPEIAKELDLQAAELFRRARRGPYDAVLIHNALRRYKYLINASNNIYKNMIYGKQHHFYREIHEPGFLRIEALKYFPCNIIENKKRLHWVQPWADTRYQVYLSNKICMALIKHASGGRITQGLCNYIQTFLYPQGGSNKNQLVSLEVSTSFTITLNIEKIGRALKSTIREVYTRNWFLNRGAASLEF